MNGDAGRTLSELLGRRQTTASDDPQWMRGKSSYLQNSWVMPPLVMDILVFYTCHQQLALTNASSSGSSPENVSRTKAIEQPPMNEPLLREVALFKVGPDSLVVCVWALRKPTVLAMVPPRGTKFLRKVDLTDPRPWRELRLPSTRRTAASAAVLLQVAEFS